MFAGTRIIAIDNVQLPLGSAFLCSSLTQATVSPRILGKSESVLVPNRFLITATGNNIVLAGDLNRRSLLCRLDPRCERPELREFDFEPVRRAMELRPQLVTAALTILRAFKLCGKPSGRPALGSFEQWSALIRDAMFWVGIEDPTGTIETIRASDPELRALTSVMTEWKKKIGMDRVAVGVGDRSRHRTGGPRPARSPSRHRWRAWRDQQLALGPVAQPQRRPHRRRLALSANRKAGARHLDRPPSTGPRRMLVQGGAVC